MNAQASVRRLADGVMPQAVITGALSFAHIHDLAAAHGQTGWKAWTYPLSVDLLTVAAYRKLVTAHRTGAATGIKALTWCWFLLALTASLAANVVATGGRDPLSLAVGVWPAVAFLGCTLLGHSSPATAVPTRHTVEHVTVERLTVDTPGQSQGSESRPEVPDALLAFARRIATEHHAAHGAPIDPATLRTRLGVPEPLAAAVHAQLSAT